jgi:hypothetical protein
MAEPSESSAKEADPQVSHPNAASLNSSTPDEANEPAPASVEPLQERPRPIVKRRLRAASAWTASESKKAMVPAVVGGAVSLIVSLVLFHVQQDDSAAQTHSSDQLQQLVNLQSAARNEINALDAVYNFQTECSSRDDSWSQCGGISPGLSTWNADASLEESDTNDVQNPSIKNLAGQFDGLCITTVGASSGKAAQADYAELLTVYSSLDSQLGLQISSN